VPPEYNAATIVPHDEVAENKGRLSDVRVEKSKMNAVLGDILCNG
jgi:hypothetical protein